MGGPFVLPKMPTLPSIRVKRSKPFQYCGLDYFGHIWTKTHQTLEKQKIRTCLVTCLTARAIHLELVRNLSTESFLIAFRHFVARRRTPERLFSDNVTDFKAATPLRRNDCMNVASSGDCLNYFSSKGIEWHFITQYAPWKGGYYERLIGLVKTILKKAIGRRILLEDEYSTLTCEIEAVLNSRPLIYLDDEIRSKTLRPVDLISPDTCIGIPPVNSLDEDPNDEEYRPPNEGNLLKLMHQRSVETLDKFWELWKSQYLLSLRETHRDKHKNPRIEERDIPHEGEVVIVKEESLTRGSWKLAHISEVIRDPDGEIRTAVITTPGGKETRRAINQLYPLEIRNQKRKLLQKGRPNPRF